VHKRFRVFGKAASTYRREMKVAGRLAGKIVIVTDYKEYAGADIVKLFREEDGEVFAVDRDLTIPSAADDLIREVGHVDILVANLAYPHKYAPAHQKSDEDMEYAMQRLFYPLHRLTRAVLNPEVVDADLADYFGSIPHARRCWSGSVARSSSSAAPTVCAVEAAAWPSTVVHAPLSMAI
jgi:NAD(P)-dependent dehydrogenase (short-subunit alcohol dehydrogenase family)